MPLSKPSWFRVIHSHFILCTLLGLMVLEAFRDALHRLSTLEGRPLLAGIIEWILVSGLLVAAATWLIHRIWIRRIRKKFGVLPGAPEQGRASYRGATVGFFCGALCPVYFIFPDLLVLLAVVFLVLIVGYFRTFLARAAVILRPGIFPRPSDVLHLVFLYLAIIACFTVLNASLSFIHKLVGIETHAFRGLEEGTMHIIDAFYFTVVVMTTLGFGDISPATSDAKLIVALEVVIAYLMFALLIGTITRGILPRESVEETPQEDPPESR